MPPAVFTREFDRLLIMPAVSHALPHALFTAHADEPSAKLIPRGQNSATSFWLNTEHNSRYYCVLTFFPAGFPRQGGKSPAADLMHSISDDSLRATSDCRGRAATVFRAHPDGVSADVAEAHRLGERRKDSRSRPFRGNCRGILRVCHARP